MKGSRSISRSLRVVTLVLALPVVAASAEVVETPPQITVNPTANYSQELIYSVLVEGLPAISADRKEVAFMFSPGDSDYSAAVIDIVRTKDNRRLKRFTLLTDEQGSQNQDDATRELLWDRMVAPNDYLKSKGFVSMPKLFTLQWNSTLLEVDVVYKIGKKISYNNERGELTITSLDSEKIQLRLHRPAVTPEPLPGAPIVGLEQIPFDGWIDEKSQSVVFRLATLTRDESTYADEWLVQRLKASN